MRTVKSLSLIAVALVASWGGLRLSLLTDTPSFARSVATTPNVGVGPQYDTAHVYVAPEDFDRFVGSLVATFRRHGLKAGCVHRDADAEQHDQLFFLGVWQPATIPCLRRSAKPPNGAQSLA